MTSDDGIRVPPRPKWLTLLLIGVLALSAGAAGWATSQVLPAAQEEDPEEGFALVEVRQGRVVSSLQLNVSSRWSARTSGTNRAAGVVTGVEAMPGELLENGAELYRVNERPVSIAEGEVPAFRDLTQGIEGNDVRQLQQMLVDTGYLTGAPDGDFGISTVGAVKSWQADAGIKADGLVRLGDIIFVPETLPARVTLDGAVIHRDASVSGNEAVLKALPVEPEFTLVVTGPQAAMITDGAQVMIESPNGSTWKAVVSGRGRMRSDTLTLRLDGLNGRRVCGADCDQIPVEGESLLPSEVITTPETSGLVLPTAALKTTGNGSTVVVRDDGSTSQVQVKASASGMAVVTGLQEGEMVRVPGEGLS